jgi:hypothetical protein
LLENDCQPIKAVNPNIKPLTAKAGIKPFLLATGVFSGTDIGIPNKIRP